MDSSTGSDPLLVLEWFKASGYLISPRPVKIERNRRCKSKGVYASLFGVGAPEALVIGVVALLVFGPKGLAEEVSREFKSTLEREIGLDEIQGSTPNTYSSNTTKTPTPSSIFSPEDSQTVVDPNGAPSPNKAYSTEDYLKITEVQLKAAAAQQQAQTTPAGESKSELQTRPQDAVQEAAAVMPPDQKPKSNLHLLAHRRHVTTNVTLSSEEVLLRPQSLLLSIEGPGAE
ncbi:hypothetical protein C3L33_03240, partial [Rhododendron williamsianum]